MIKLNEEFAFERDAYGWQLYQWRDGKDKDGNPKRHKNTSYYPNLHQISSAIIDRSAGACQSMTDLQSLLKAAENGLTEYLEEQSP